MNHLERADHVGADLVHAYAKLDTLCAVVRMTESNELRVIAPADSYEALALMFYRAADEMAAHAPRKAPFPGKSS